MNSVDYLLKPVDPEKLDRALTKLSRIRGGSESRPDMRQLFSTSWPPFSIRDRLMRRGYLPAQATVWSSSTCGR